MKLHFLHLHEDGRGAAHRSACAGKLFFLVNVILSLLLQRCESFFNQTGLTAASSELSLNLCVWLVKTCSLLWLRKCCHFLFDMHLLSRRMEKPWRLCPVVKAYCCAQQLRFIQSSKKLREAVEPHMLVSEVLLVLEHAADSTAGACLVQSCWPLSKG